MKKILLLIGMLTPMSAIAKNKYTVGSFVNEQCELIYQQGKGPGGDFNRKNWTRDKRCSNNQDKCFRIGNQIINFKTGTIFRWWNGVLKTDNKCTVENLSK